METFTLAKAEHDAHILFQTIIHLYGAGKDFYINKYATLPVLESSGLISQKGREPSSSKLDQ